MAMTLRLTAEQDRALALLAAAQGRSKHDAAVRAIVAGPGAWQEIDRPEDIAAWTGQEKGQA